MSKLVHRIYIYLMVLMVVATAVFIFLEAYSYYSTPLAERFYHPDHAKFKPSGVYGHGLGIVGTLLIIIGVFSYIIRKRNRKLARFGRLKHWLEFHIFLCSLGPVMVLFHTSFKFGGIVSISFWSMVAVVASGVIGRFIYVQIPRSIEGRELSLGEIQAIKQDIAMAIENTPNIDQQSVMALRAAMEGQKAASGDAFSRMIKQYFIDRRTVSVVAHTLRQHQVPTVDVRNITRMLKDEITLTHRIGRLQTMQQLFKYWHVAHLPFAVIMLIIMIVHVAITLAFGYKWIF